jgi:hypothetical protein
MTGDAHDIDDTLHGPSDLFLVRLWGADASKDTSSWRGRVQMVVNGEVHYFQGIQELIDAMLGMLSPNGQATSRQAPPQPAVEEGS